MGLRLLLPNVYAAPAEVNSALDLDNPGDGLCTLREAILTANGAGIYTECGPAFDNTIVFAPAITEIVINSGAPLPPLTAGGITINGGGNVTLRGDRTGAGTAGSGLTINSADNVIRGLNIVEFPLHGIVITGDAAQRNRIFSNLIGLVPGDPDPGLVNANGASGVLITGGAVNNVIGPSGAGQNRNIIGHNLINGVQIQGINSGDPNTETRRNRVVGNWIGLSEDGITTRPNGFDGVLITDGAADNTIGGSDADRNIISGNNRYGVFVSTNSTRTIVAFNTIGRDPSGSQPRPNLNGVEIANNSSFNTVNNNLIANNAANGLVLREIGTNNSVVRDNIIRNNGNDGVLVTNQARNNIIGPNNIIRNNNGSGVQIDGFGTENNTVRLNTIRNNQLAGITVGLDPTDGTVGNRLTQNAIFANGGIGIDLGADGDTANDPGDGDTGPNLLQNHPVLQFAVDNGLELAIVGTMDGQPAQAPFRLEFFRPDVAFGGVAGVRGEGQTFLGAASSGVALTNTVLARLGLGATPDFITATAISAQNNTSEFAVNIPVEILRARFTANPISGVQPLNVQFTDASIGNIGGRTWDFGDGSPPVNAVNPAHTFNNPGVYTVTLTVAHISGLVFATATQQIEVLPAILPPTPTATDTSTATPTDIATSTPLPTNTATPIPTSTATPLPTSTPLPTNTATPIPTSTATPLPTSTPLPTNTATPIPTNTPLPTSTDTPIPTSTPQPTDTPVPTDTPFPTALPTATETPGPDIEIEKEEVDDDTFEIIIRNGGGPGDLTVIEQLRPGVIYVAAQPGAPFCREDQGVITCSLGTLPGGAEANIQITVNAQGVDITSGFTTVRVGDRVATLDEPYIVKVSQPPFAAPGSPITYTIRVINPTGRTITGITVRDAMPDGVRVLSATATSGTVTVSGQAITLTQASLGAGERITLTISAELLDIEAQPQLINRACLTTTTSPTPRCAVSGFVRASQLPGTGETPLAQHWVLIFGGLVALLTGVLLRYLLRRAA